MHKPFPEIHQGIIERLQGTTICVGKEGSYIKLFQAAIHYSLNNLQKVKAKRNWFRQTSPVHFLYLIFLYLNTFFAKKVKLTKWVILDHGRQTVDGKSVYFHRIRSFTKLGEASYITRQCMEQIPEAVHLDQIENKFPLFHKTYLKYWQDLRRVFRQAKYSKRFTEDELDFLGSVFQSFMNRLGKSLVAYENQGIQAFVFSAHYLSEGNIAALQALNIEVIEVQHGLISEEDMYYVYDHRYAPWLKKAFFPNQVWLYGDLWKSRLKKGLETQEQTLHTIGDYTELFGPVKSTQAKKKQLLICTQKTLAEDYLPWVQRIVASAINHPDWNIVIKLHPGERPADISRYVEMENNQVKVVLKASLSDLFEESSLQCSIYSTTLYDDIGYGVMNYVLMDSSKHGSYVQEMIDSRVAVGISMEDDPIALFEQGWGRDLLLKDRNAVYGPFNHQAVDRLLSSLSK
jgi:hypothetical protein